MTRCSFFRKWPPPMIFNKTVRDTFLLGLLIHLGTTVGAQVNWEYSGAGEFPASMAWGAIEVDPELYYTVIEEYVPASPSNIQLRFIGPEGLGDDLPITTRPGWRHRGVGIYTDRPNGRRHLVGVVMDTLGNMGQQLGLFHSVTNLEFDTVFTALHPIAPGCRFISGALTQLNDGDVLYVAGMNTINDPDLRDKVVFVRLHSDGSPPDIRIHEGTVGVDAFVVNDVDEEPNGYRVTFQGAEGIGPSGYGKLVYYDHDFNYVDALIIPNANGLPYQSGQDTAFAIYQSETTPSGDVLVSCERIIAFTPFAFQVQATLIKLSSQGDLVNTFYTPIPPLGVYSRIIRNSLVPTPDGNFTWGYEENDDFMEPSRVHLYKLSQDLDVLGYILLDGSVLDTHFWPRSLQSTSDGGLIICGAADGLEDGNWLSHAYVAKLGGFTHIGEEAAPALDVVAYPNPGQNLRIAVNDAILQNATVQLFDATGRVVAKTPLHYNQAYLDCNALGTGLYGYRIVDAFGMVRASGKWVRE